MAWLGWNAAGENKFVGMAEEGTIRWDWMKLLGGRALQPWILRYDGSQSKAAFTLSTSTAIIQEEVVYERRL